MKIPINFEDRPNKKEVFNFLYKALEKDHPIAFLNLDNGKENKLHRWHWVAIVGIAYDDLSDKLEATIADEGMLKKINLGLWLTTAKNEGICSKSIMLCRHTKMLFRVFIFYIFFL